MIRIYLIVALVLIWVLWMQWNSAPDEASRRLILRNLIMYGLIGAIFLLAATGRIHWLGAVFAGLFPVFKFIFASLLRQFPSIAQIYAKHSNQQTKTAQTSMGAAEAREILGVPGDANQDEIQKAYKNQMQRVHPDKGGSAYFASKLNEARDVLLQNLNS